MAGRYRLAGPAFTWLLALGMMAWFARPGLGLYFTDDDVMNLRRAWTDPVSRLLLQIVTFGADSYRPAGLLWYKAVFRVAGLHPLVFRLVAFAILAFNLGLLHRLAVRLSGSREIAMLAVLIGCFHSRLDSLYCGASTIFDILCYAFYLGALTYYIGCRTGRHPAPIGGE